MQSVSDDSVSANKEDSESIEDYYKDIIYGVYDKAYENSIAYSKDDEEDGINFILFNPSFFKLISEQCSNTSESFSLHRKPESSSSSSSEDLCNELRSL